MGEHALNQQPKRVSPIHAPEQYGLPGRPDGAPDSVLDAYRQTQFLLGSDLSLFAEAMNLQLRLMRDSYPSQYRTLVLAAVIGLWSRIFQYLGDGVLLLTRGSYPSTLPLIRAAAESMAAAEAIRSGETEEYVEWVEATLTPSVEHRAIDIELGTFFSGSVLASDAVLGSVWRPVSNLSRPNFGATLIQVGPESNNQRLTLTFADRSFHLGWAELVLGWLIRLAVRQVQIAVDAEPMMPVSDEVRTLWTDLASRAEKALAREDRCVIEEVDEAGFRRYLLHNFRRNSTAAPRKLLL
jgi:hypothetical protein